MGRIKQRMLAVHAMCPGDPGGQQRALAEEFGNIMADTQFNLWKPGDPISDLGTRWLIGVAVWSGYDWDLLNQLDGHLLISQCDDVFDVFDIDAAFTAHGSFEKHISDLGKIFHTPLVGLWEDGALINKGSGYAGRKLVIDRYGLTLKSLGG